MESLGDWELALTASARPPAINPDRVAVALAWVGRAVGHHRQACPTAGGQEGRGGGLRS